MKLMLKLLALALTCAVLNAAAQNNLRRLPPIPGEPVKTSLSDVQAAIRTLVALDVAVTIQTHTNYAEPVAYHFRAVADVFKLMPTNGTFSVEHLRAELAKLLPPAEVDLSGVREAIVTVYARAYAHRGRASIPNLEYLTGISTTFAQAIREGISKGGKSAVVSER